MSNKQQTFPIIQIQSKLLLSRAGRTRGFVHCYIGKVRCFLLVQADNIRQSPLWRGPEGMGNAQAVTYPRILGNFLPVAQSTSSLLDDHQQSFACCNWRTDPSRCFRQSTQRLQVPLSSQRSVTQIPLFYPRCWAAPLGELRPSLRWKGLLFIARAGWLYRDAPPGAAHRVEFSAQAVTLTSRRTDGLKEGVSLTILGRYRHICCFKHYCNSLSRPRP